MGLLDETTEAQYYNSNNYGGYQFISLNDIINQFIVAYVGEDKIISKELIHLKNPISSDLNTMRPSTIPNLLEAINQNKARLYLNAKIFEVGPNFSKSFSNSNYVNKLLSEIVKNH